MCVSCDMFHENSSLVVRAGLEPETSGCQVRRPNPLLQLIYSGPFQRKRSVKIFTLGAASGLENCGTLIPRIWGI